MIKRIFHALLLAGCFVAGGFAPLAQGAQGAQGEDSALQNTGDCYVALHGLDDDSYSYDPYPKESSMSDYWHEMIRDARYEFDYPPEALEECKKAFAAGDASSGFWIGEYLMMSGKTQLDNDKIEEAFSYYEKAAEMGDVLSLHFLGLYYIRGGFVEKDIDKGLEYLKRAADMGYGRSQFIYAHFYDRGEGIVEPVLPKAWEYYHRAADNGDTLAMLKLGGIYLNLGVSGQCAEEKALARWTTAEQDARYKKIGRETYAELNIECDQEKGLNYIRDAAMLGNESAIGYLSYFYEQRGDVEEALKWHALMWEWEHTDIFHMASFPYSPSIVNLWPDYRKLCDDQHVSQEYIESVREGGQADKVAAAKSWAVEAKADMPEQHCKYSDYSWHYQCRNNIEGVVAKTGE